MAKQKKELTPIEKKNLRHIFWCSGQMWGDFTMVKMEGNTYAYCMLPVINEVYGDNEALKTEAFVRNTEFFNTHAAASGLVFGLSYALERERSADPYAVSGEMITNIKTSLMGPLAAVGDSIFFNCIRVIAAGIGISLASQGNPLGVLLFVGIYGGIFLAVKWYLLNLGYTVGTDTITKAFKSGIIQALSDAACAMGLVMVGSLVSSMVSISSPAEIPMGGGTTMVLQDIFDGIIPGFLKLVLLFSIVAMVRKKWKPIWIIFLILGIGVLGSVLGVL
ncbi:MAG: PTS system mannose/fructose/sorbose family transporter subunit IID [Solobacterium sp.]|jgi:mannose/fructose/N-acetylgalactosamine-specific phosphotransferase system component IID|nr:PTS system mannose/fructose/sorbose family transporter subunit IID [Solobacterium sp.]MCH4265333.1 PTS system mannose/fructose/sorbose family transporter subunit IID [Solobacterium sp.]